MHWDNLTSIAWLVCLDQRRDQSGRSNEGTNAPSSNVRNFLTRACVPVRHIGVYVEQLLLGKLSPPR